MGPGFQKRLSRQRYPIEVGCTIVQSETDPLSVSAPGVLHGGHSCSVRTARHHVGVTGAIFVATALGNSTAR